MAHYDIFRERLAMKYPAFGHALWEPDSPVQVGDVGFIREGRFERLFNALLPEDDRSQEFGVPEHYEPLVPSLSNHIYGGSLSPNNYCSGGVSVGADPGYHPPDDFRQVSFQHTRTRGAAVLSLPVLTRRENTRAQGEFGKWIVKHIGSWFAFAQGLGMGIAGMEEIILVTGCDRTRSWTNIAFLGGQADAQVSFGVRVQGLDTNIHYQLLPELVRGAVISQGPEGTNLPENQCVFIRGFRVSRSFWPLPKHLKAAAGPSRDPGGYDRGLDTELVSTPAIPKYRDPLHLLLDYIAEQASDCDTVLAHDNDLVMIKEIGHDTSLETLEPSVMIDLLRRSDIEIHEVLCDSSPTNSLSGSNTDTASVKIAMLPMTFQNWNTASPRSPLTSQNIDLDHASESRGAPPPAVPGNLPAPTIIQNELGRSHPAYAGTYSQAPQVLTPAAVQAQPSVPGAQGLGPSPMTTVSPHGSKVRQQPMPHEYTRVFNAGGGFANANVGPTAGASPGMKRNEWTGVLYLNGTCAHARARGSDAVGNPNIFAWPMHLQLEPVVNPKFDINAWIGNTRAPHVPLGCLDETDRYHFDHLVGTLSRSGGYAVVRWNIGGQIRERLLLAPAASASGQTLLCAEFPHDGIPMGLTHQVTTNPHHDA